MNHLKIEVKKGKTFVEFDNYTLFNSKGESGSLDDWMNGKSGYQLKFNEPIYSEVRKSFTTYGQVVDKKENPLKNRF